MAGSQFTGPLTASGALFRDRTWVVTPVEGNTADDVAVIEKMATDVGARVVVMPPDEHDEAVAQVSHVPHLMSILTASHLREVPVDNLRLAGQGIRDVTRIAGSDPGLWRQILTSNAAAVRHELEEVAADLVHLIEVLDRPDELERFLALGQTGAHSLVGKHGNDPLDLVQVTVEIPTNRVRWAVCSPTSARRVSTSRTSNSPMIPSAKSATCRSRSKATSLSSSVATSWDRAGRCGQRTGEASRC